MDPAAAIAISKLATVPGAELDYKEVTSNQTSTGTTAANAQAVITGNAVTFDGTAIWISFFTGGGAWSTTANDVVVGDIYEDSTDKGLLVRCLSPLTTQGINVFGRRKLTPAAGSHTYSVRFWNATAARTVTVGAGAGGAGVDVPMFLHITKA